MESENIKSKGLEEEMDLEDLSEEEAEEMLAKLEEMQLALEAERKKILEDLAFSIEKKFETRKKNRASKEAEWSESMRLWMGALSPGGVSRSPDRPFETWDEKHRPDRNIIQIKCDITVAQQIDMQFAGGDKNWDINPPSRVAMEVDPASVTRAAMEMERTIQAQLSKTKYGFKSRKAMFDRVVLGTGVIKGPTNSGSLRTIYRQDPNTGEYYPELTTEYVPELEHVNLWLFYPDDTTNDPCAIEDSIQVHPMSKSELGKLRKNPGYISDVIDDILSSPPKDLNDPSFSEFTRFSDSNSQLFKNKYLVLEYHGPITSDQLNSLSIEPSYETPLEEYYGEVWVCNGQIIRLELSNIEGAYETPYSICPWKEDPSSVFGISLPLILRDHQRVVTQTWHMILDNASISSGPQVLLQKNAIEPANGSWEFDPRKVWFHTDYGTDINQAFHFFMPPNVGGELLNLVQAASQFAEEESGVSMMSAGLDSSAIAESATGQAILNQNSSLLGDMFAEGWDDRVTEKVIRRYYAWNMQYNPDPTIKGAFDIDVRSMTEYKNKLMITRELERINMEAQQNPEMGLYINQGEMIKARLSMANLPNESILRSEEEVEQMRQQQAEQQANQIDPNMIEMRKLDIEKEKLELEKAKLQFELNQQQQREIMEHQEKLSSNYARIAEAEAQAVRTQNEKEIELIRLASKKELTLAQLKKEYEIALVNDQTKKFLAGVDSVRKNRAQLLNEKEYELAVRTGKGF